MSDKVNIPNQIIKQMVQRSEVGVEYKFREEVTQQNRAENNIVTYVYEATKNVEDNCYLLVVKRKIDGKYFGTPINYSRVKNLQNSTERGTTSCYEMQLVTKDPDLKQYVFTG